MSPGPDWVWPLPRDVRGALAAPEDAGFPKAQPPRVTNPGLLLHKYVPYPWQGSGDSWSWKYSYTLPNGKKRETSKKPDSWMQVVAGLSKACKDRGGVAQAAGHAEKRLDQCCTALANLGYTTASDVFQVSWRLVVGLGLPSPLETGIVLHHVYGVPVIPGSALKGLTRAWRLRSIAEILGVPQLEPVHAEEWTSRRKLDFGPTPLDLLELLLSSPSPGTSDTRDRRDVEKGNMLLQDVFKGERGNKLREWGYCLPASPFSAPESPIGPYQESFSRAFGSTEAQGEVIFLDALPQSLVVNNESLLELDVMNPHYTKYYEKKSPPADSLEPVPVPFLAVRKDAQFRVRVLSKDGVLLKEVYGWLTCALDEFGIGAKTRAGYGQMVPSGVGKPAVGGEPAAPGSRDLAIEQAIDSFRPGSMGTLPALVESIQRLPDGEYRSRLASRLQGRLRTMGQWKEANRSKAWFIALAKLLPPGGQDQP